jgi:glutaredoxin 3
MADIVIYTTPFCGYCARAKALLKKKGAPFTEIDVEYDPDLRQQMRDRAGGRRTVPQVFIGDIHVGGSDDLYALEVGGKLDALLSP